MLVDIQTYIAIYQYLPQMLTALELILGITCRVAVTLLGHF